MGRKRRRRLEAGAVRHLGGGAREDRTPDLVIANDALSQLSYGPMERVFGSVDRERARMITRGRRVAKSGNG